MIFTNEDKNKKTKIPAYYIKAVVHIIDDKFNFEVLEEEFFSTAVNKSGWMISQSDLDIRLEHELYDIDWMQNKNIKIDDYLGILISFNMNYYQYDNGGGIEYDSTVEIIDMEIEQLPSDLFKNKELTI